MGLYIAFSHPHQLLEIETIKLSHVAWALPVLLLSDSRPLHWTIEKTVYFSIPTSRLFLGQWGCKKRELSSQTSILLEIQPWNKGDELVRRTHYLEPNRSCIRHATCQSDRPSNEMKWNQMKISTIFFFLNPSDIDLISEDHSETIIPRWTYVQGGLIVTLRSSVILLT